MKFITLNFFLVAILSFGCNSEEGEKKEALLQYSASATENSVQSKGLHPKAFIDLIRSKAETAQDLPNDFDLSVNYTEEVLEKLGLAPEEVKPNEYYFLSGQNFLKAEIEGTTFQIYYKYLAGSQLEKILRVQKADTVFDVTLAGTYRNEVDSSTLSTEFTDFRTFKQFFVHVQKIKDKPHVKSYDIDSLITTYKYSSRFDVKRGEDFSSRWYKEVSEHPETGKRDTLVERIYFLGKVQATEFIGLVAYTEYDKRLPETVTIYAKNKNRLTPLKVIETHGTYVSKFDFFTLNENHFISVELVETSGNSYSLFYSLDSRKNELREVRLAGCKHQFPDSLQLHSAYAISRKADNTFKAGALGRSKKEDYYIETEYSLARKEGGFVLRCIAEEVYLIE